MGAINAAAQVGQTETRHPSREEYLLADNGVIGDSGAKRREVQFQAGSGETEQSELGNWQTAREESGERGVVNRFRTRRWCE